MQLNAIQYKIYNNLIYFIFWNCFYFYPKNKIYMEINSINELWLSKLNQQYFYFTVYIQFCLLFEKIKICEK